MGKILVIGEHPANLSGFGRLNNYISTALVESGKFEDVASLGIVPKKVNPVVEGAKYLTLNSPIYGGDKSHDNMYGQISLAKFLGENSEYTDVLCIGDPWYFESVPIMKAIFPHITFHYYCPVEGEKLPPIVYNAAQSISNRIDIRKILGSMDHVMGYSQTGMDAINFVMGKEVCKEYVYHWVDAPKQKPAEIPALKAAIEGKFIIGCLGRNCYRKSIDSILMLAELLATEYKGLNAMILAHVPRVDSFGFDIDSVMLQLDPAAKDCLKFTEEIMPDIFVSDTGQGRVRDIKSGASQDKLEYIYSIMDVFLNVSRSEGFGFPIAEAMVRGIPVIVNGYATPAEVLKAAGSTPTVVPIAAKEFYASGNNALMGIPDVRGIAETINKLARDPLTRKDLADKQQEFAVANLQTENSPHRSNIVEYIIGARKEARGSSTIFITSPMEKCGIRTYTNNIAEHIPDSTSIGIGNLMALYKMISQVRGKTFHIQYETALWKKDDAIKLVDHMKKGNNHVVVTVHTVNTDFLQGVDGRVDHFIFHSREKTWEDVVSKSPVTVIPHAFPTYNLDEARRKEIKDEMGVKEGEIVIGLNGFALPYKHLAEQAASIIQMIRNSREYGYRLMMVCSRHSKDSVNMGKRILDSIQSYAKMFGVEDRVFVKYEFLPKLEMATYLSIMDFALFFHNLRSVGAQSGSVRELISSGVIPVVTKSAELKMHDDIVTNKCAFGIAAKEGQLGPQAFSQAACSLIHNMSRTGKLRETMAEVEAAQKEYLSKNTFELAAQKHIDIYNKIKGETHEQTN